MNANEYQEARDNNMGYCTTCQEFSREMTEPDAECYNCPQCGELKVYGAEQALLMGIIDLEETGLPED